MIDYSYIAREFPGRINDDDCLRGCSGEHRCCVPPQYHPLLPGEGDFLRKQGYGVEYDASAGFDIFTCLGKHMCPGNLRPVMCRTYPIHPGPQGLKVDQACSEAPWLSWDFINQMERMWRYLFAADETVMPLMARLERSVWSKQPEVPLWKIERPFDSEYSKRYRQWFNTSVAEEVLTTGWVQPGDTILDVGGGAGERIPLLGSKGVSVTVMDINPELAKVAGGILGDVQDMPCPDGAYDVVYCFDVLEHVSEPTKAIREMLRVSKGRVIVYVTTIADLDNLLLDPKHKVFLPFSEWLRLFSSVAEIVAVDWAYTGALLTNKVED